jgi:hypothetical protein
MEAAARLATVHIGKAFEERSLSILQSRLSMSLTRVGGTGDGGVDLQGWWWLPRLPSDTSTVPGGHDRRRIRVLASCKAFQTKLGPLHVRELEGVIMQQGGSAMLPNLGPIDEPTPESESPIPELVAMLISHSGFTLGAVRRTMASPVPFMLLDLPAPESETEADQPSIQPLPTSRVSEPIGSIIWNPRLGGPSGLLGGHLRVHWELGRGGRPVLYWRGRRLKHWVPEIEPEKIISRFDLAQPALSS